MIRHLSDGDNGMLMQAYLDGEVSVAESRRLREAFAGDHALAKAVLNELRTESLITEVLAESYMPWGAAAISGLEDRPAGKGNKRIVKIPAPARTRLVIGPPRPLRGRRRSRWSRASGALAAAAALAVLTISFLYATNILRGEYSSVLLVNVGRDVRTARLPDGTVVRIFPGSRAEARGRDDARSLRQLIMLDRGEIEIYAPSAPKNQTACRVETPEGFWVETVGTRFRVTRTFEDDRGERSMNKRKLTGAVVGVLLVAVLEGEVRTGGGHAGERRVSAGGDAEIRGASREATMVAPTEEEWRANILRKLQRPVSFEFVKSPLTEVLAFMRKNTGVNIILDPAVKAGGEKPITLRMTDARAKLALDWILKAADLAYELRDNAIFISVLANLKPDAAMRIYDVSDLLVPLVDCPGPDLDLCGQPVLGTRKAITGVFISEPTTDAEALADEVRTLIKPESWAPKLSTSIEARDNKLVIVQRPEVHCQVSAFLTGLRAQAVGQIEVTARFYAVADDAVKEAEKTGTLLAEAVALARSGQRVHCHRGKIMPATKASRSRLLGAVLDVRPILSEDGKRVLVEGNMGLWREAAGKAGAVHVWRTPPHVRIPLGQRVRLVMGRLNAKSSEPQLVVAVLSARAKWGKATSEKPEAEPAWKLRVRKELAKEVNVEFVKQPLGECINYLRKLTRVSVITDTKAFASGKIDTKTPITLRLKKTRLETAFKWVLRMAELDYRLKGGAVFISTPEILQGEVVQKAYDVRALTHAFRHYSAPDKAVLNRAPVVGASPKSLADILERSVHPESWSHPDKCIGEKGGKLTVVQLPEVHAKIRKLIATLGAQIRPEIRVDVRLYSLPAEVRATTPETTETEGQLLSRLGTAGANGQRLYCLGGTARTVKGEKKVSFRGALVEVQPTLSHDRRYISLDTRVSWSDQKMNTAKLRGNLSLEVGKPAVFSLGAADGKRMAAVITASLGK